MDWNGQQALGASLCLIETHQREGTVDADERSRISDDESQALVGEMKAIFVGSLSAQEFSADKRRARIWWR